MTVGVMVAVAPAACRMAEGGRLAAVMVAGWLWASEVGCMMVEGIPKVVGVRVTAPPPPPDNVTAGGPGGGSSVAVPACPPGW